MFGDFERSDALLNLDHHSIRLVLLRGKNGGDEKLVNYAGSSV